MKKTKVVVKVSPGKSKGGTIIARQVVKLRKNGAGKGAPLFQTKAQLNVHLKSKDGQQRD